MKKRDAAREAKIEALRDFDADRRMGNHAKPLSVSKADKPTSDCSCSDADRRMQNHQKPLKFTKETP